MLDFKSMKPEEFEYYRKYLEALTEVLDTIVEPAMLTFEDKEYCVAMEGPVTAVIENNNDNLKPYAVMLDEEGRMIRYFDENFIYETSFNKTNYIVCRKAIATELIEQVYFEPREENNPHDYLNYYYKNPEADKELQIRYDVTRFNENLELFFYYINSKFPEGIYLNHFTKLFGMIPKIKHEWFVQVDDNDDYGKLILPTMFVGPTAYTLADVKAYLREVGMPDGIPRYMENMFLKKDESVKKLELISSEYRNFLKG